MARFLMIAYSTYARDARVKRHVEALADRGDSVDVICLADEQLRPRPGVNLMGIALPRYQGASPAGYLLSYLRFFAAASAKAWQRSRGQNYKAAIVCSMPDAAILSAVPLRMFGTRLILDVHDTMPELCLDKFAGRVGAIGARALMLEERWSGRLADRVLAVHDLHRARLEAAGISPGKIRVVVNSPDGKIFAPLQDRATQRDAFTIVCHGTITRRLGLDVAFQAIEELRQKIPTLRLVVVGRGDYIAVAKETVGRMGLEDRISFLPAVPVEELPALLRQADVGLVPNLPSAASHLMLPVKLTEYAALGIPVIAARLRTIEHYFGCGAVRLFEPGNPHSLALAIGELYEDRSRGAELALRASQVLRSIGWELQRRAFFDAIDSVL
jgi:glycosyltransferase involved in cell wall biosynthesis